MKEKIVMHDYSIFNFDEDSISQVVLITSTEDPYYLYETIFDELSVRNGETFTVLVDLFLRNGYSFNRYCLLKFNNKNEVKSFIISPREVSENIKKTIRVYLQKNPEVLSESALSRNIINYVKSG